MPWALLGAAAKLGFAWIPEGYKLGREIVKDILSTRLGCAALAAIAVWFWMSHKAEEDLALHDKQRDAEFALVLKAKATEIRTDLENQRRKQETESAAAAAEAQLEIQHYDPGPKRSDDCNLVGDRLADQLQSITAGQRKVKPGAASKK